MNLQQAQSLKIGDTIFFHYIEAKVDSKIRDYGSGNIHMDVYQKSSIYGAHIDGIFFPTEHVKKVSQIVSEKIKEFETMKCLGANVNPSIFGLFNDHWEILCNSENNPVQYELHKKNFESFIKELHKVAKSVNNAMVNGVMYLSR